MPNINLDGANKFQGFQGSRECGLNRPEQECQGEDLDAGERLAEEEAGAVLLLDPAEQIEGVGGAGRRTQGLPQAGLDPERVALVNHVLEFHLRM